MNNILTSIIVAVYNRENLLDRCIDSLVYQTVDNIEIILVDDQSTDNSLEIMGKWQAQFPEKIVILSNPNKGVSNAKNLGIANARGRYVTFVDSDDYVEYKMLERLHKCAEENNYPELVHSPIWSIKGKKKSQYAVLKGNGTIEDYLQMQTFFLPGKLIKRDLFERHGYLPQYTIGEDVSWMFPVISNLKEVIYSKTPGYFYELSENSISLNTLDINLFWDIVKGSEQIIRETNPVYKKYAIVYGYGRIKNLVANRPNFKDLAKKYIKENLGIIEEYKSEIEECDPDLNMFIKECVEYYSEIPEIIYINGFTEYDLDKSIKKYENVFRDKVQVIALNEENCDIQLAPKCIINAYEVGELEFVAKYFAVKSCYEQGGIYLDNIIEIDNVFNCLKNDPCFFGYESDENFSDKIFGSCPGNPCFQKILATYNFPDLYENEFAPLSQRIKTILVGMGNVTLTSCEKRELNYGFCIYPVEMFVYTLPFSEKTHVCHYSEQALSGENNICVSVDIFKSLFNRSVRKKVDRNNIELRKKTRQYEREKEKSKKLVKKIEKLEQKHTAMLNSKAWKVAEALRNVRKKLG